MMTHNLREQKKSFYKQQKSRLEALLAVVQRKEVFIKIIRKAANEEEARTNLASHFNLTLTQAKYLLNQELRKFMAVEYEELQKEYDKVVRFCQLLGQNNKKL
jgi:DNA gyrase/topoisomerase IV subunit A